MTRMPALFIGHGSPMNTLEHNGYTGAWRELAEALPQTKSAARCFGPLVHRGDGRDRDGDAAHDP